MKRLYDYNLSVCVTVGIHYNFRKYVSIVTIMYDNEDDYSMIKQAMVQHDPACRAVEIYGIFVSFALKSTLYGCFYDI